MMNLHRKSRSWATCIQAVNDVAIQSPALTTEATAKLQAATDVYLGAKRIHAPAQVDEALSRLVALAPATRRAAAHVACLARASETWRRACRDATLRALQRPGIERGGVTEVHLLAALLSYESGGIGNAALSSLLQRDAKQDAERWLRGADEVLTALEQCSLQAPFDEVAAATLAAGCKTVLDGALPFERAQLVNAVQAYGIAQRGAQLHAGLRQLCDEWRDWDPVPWRVQGLSLLADRVGHPGIVALLQLESPLRSGGKCAWHEALACIPDVRDMQTQLWSVRGQQLVIDSQWTLRTDARELLRRWLDALASLGHDPSLPLPADLWSWMDAPISSASVARLREGAASDARPASVRLPPPATTMSANGRFGETGVDVRVPLNQDEVVSIGHELQAINGYASKLKEFSDAAIEKLVATVHARAKLKAKTAQLRAQLSESKSEEGGIGVGFASDVKAEVLAILREVMRRKLNIFAYDTQMLVVLALLNNPDALRGRFAQVKTGEGKTTIVAILSSYLALQGQRVDIASSSAALARRDRGKLKAFFDAFHLDTVCVEDNGYARSESTSIAFGTTFGFAFCMMYEQTALFTKPRSRHKDVLIIDEADDALLEQARTQAIISQYADDPYAWAIPHIVEYARAQQHLDGARHIVPNDFEPSKLRAYLDKRHVSVWRSSLHGVSDVELEAWYGSCLLAYNKYEPYNHYVLRPKEGAHDAKSAPKSNVVVCVDRATGQLLPSRRWSERLHQFIEFKEGVELQPENETSNRMAQHDFATRYGTILGMTGTLGSDVERDEIREVFDVDTFDAPAHRLNVRIDGPFPIMCGSTDEHTLAIVAQVRAMVAAKRPILVLMKNIRETRRISEHLTSLGIDNQIFNEVQERKEEEILARAGKPGIVTVSTNNAGRGTDIIVDEQAEAHGGLHVVLTFFADNERIELQGCGRAGRQGAPGSSCVVVCVADLKARDSDPVTASTLADIRASAVRRDKRLRQTARSEDLEFARYALDFRHKVTAFANAVRDEDVCERLRLRLARRKFPKRVPVDNDETTIFAVAMRLQQMAHDSDDGFAQAFSEWIGHLDAALFAQWESLVVAVKDAQKKKSEVPMKVSTAFILKAMFTNEVPMFLVDRDLDRAYAQLCQHTQGIWTSPEKGMEKMTLAILEQRKET